MKARHIRRQPRPWTARQRITRGLLRLASTMAKRLRRASFARQKTIAKWTADKITFGRVLPYGGRA